MPAFDSLTKSIAVQQCHARAMACKVGTDGDAFLRPGAGCISRVQPRRSVGHDGFTLLELMLVAAILAVLASIGIVSYHGYIDATKVVNAAKQIRSMSLVIDDYHEDKKVYPASLAAVGLANLNDPWGNPYHYLNIATAANLSLVRKDHNLVPLNTDYDLYSSGKDGQSSAPLTAKASLDDVVRANNGGFVGLASEY
jgi:general secretion pathway protein G